MRRTHAEADSVGEPLAERARGYLDAGRQNVFGVARSLRSPLPEVLQLFEREVVARQVEERVEEHRAVARRQEEAVAPLPLRILRVVTKEASPQDVCHRRCAERETGMTGLCLLNRVERERADCVDAKTVEFRRGVACRR